MSDKSVMQLGLDLTGSNTHSVRGNSKRLRRVKTGAECFVLWAEVMAGRGAFHPLSW